MKRITGFLQKSLCGSFLFLAAMTSLSQETTGKQQNAYVEQEPENVYVDAEGVMRWGHNDQEVQGFGVNYSVPFAHAFRSAEKLGVDVRQAMEEDVYHFTRLGFDLYRLHVWDTEISDAEGNLLENEHLDHFDYLVKLLKDRGIKMVLTPIAFWGNGWPEPDEDTPGFSHKYGKEASLTHSEAIKAQENYLAQFLNHVNPYTGTTYKEEPAVVAFEVSNEPHHREAPEAVTAFIKGMISSMRATGTNKPIFYNISHSVHLAEAYFEAGISGGTFQWYPTGLGYGQELEGNLLPNVSEYEIPFDSIIRKYSGAKLVYEFDAADVMKSYMYPAMARSFREAGIQIATHFAYDPTFMAYANTEYDTHYMNLAYTPHKALALMISGEVFRQVPLYQEQERYSDEVRFGDFYINYGEDLAELNSEDTFIYTNTTSSRPKAPEQLQQLAGHGSSPVVRYEGKGAYFLDKLEEDIWRLEVMPDALLVQNPFGDNSLDKTVGVIKHNKWEMRLDLAGLESGFQVQPLNAGNDFLPEVSGNTFTIRPGTYLLMAEEASAQEEYPNWNKEDLQRFVAPETTVEKTYVLHESAHEIGVGSNPVISAKVVSDEPIKKVEVWFRNGNTYESAELQQGRGYSYAVLIPEKLLKEGFLEYRIIVTTEESSYTFPSGVEGNPNQWDFYDDSKYRTRIVGVEAPIYLFRAIEDSEEVVGEWLPGLHLNTTNHPGEAEYQVRVEHLYEEDPENLHAEPIYDYSFRSYFNDKTTYRKQDLLEKNTLVLKGHSLKSGETPLQVAVVMENGMSYGKVVALQPEMNEYRIPLSELEPVQTVTLPRPYPSFLPYFLEHDLKTPFDMEEAESLQFSIGPGLPEAEKQEAQGVGIIHVRLE